MADSQGAVGLGVLPFSTYSPCRNYLHIVSETSVSLEFVPASNMKPYEGRPFECLPNIGHELRVLAKPRGDGAPQNLGHHLDRTGDITRITMALVGDRSEHSAAKSTY